MPRKQEKRFLEPAPAIKFTAAKRGRPGFTLIEMLISLTIIAFISTIFIVNYHSANKRSQLNMFKQKLASDIRLVLNNSLGAVAYGGPPAVSVGWGIHFQLNDNTHYTIFADIDNNKKYDIGGNETVETISLPEGLEFNSLSYNSISFLPIMPMDIVFYPPDPIIYFNETTFPLATIELGFDDIGSPDAQITINPFGLVEIRP